jgi:hypothetical protein
MTAKELKVKIKKLAKQVYRQKIKSNDAALAYDELTKFPELKAVIVDLLTSDFDKFLESIDWVAPRPTTFRINLLNGQNFFIIVDERSFVAKIEGKKYYLLNLDEEERAAQAVSRILSYGAKTKSGDGADVEGAEEIETETKDEEEV